MILALTVTKSLCLVLYRPAKASLMLWLYANDLIKRVDFFCFVAILHNIKINDFGFDCHKLSLSCIV